MLSIVGGEGGGRDGEGCAGCLKIRRGSVKPGENRDAPETELPDFRFQTPDSARLDGVSPHPLIWNLATGNSRSGS